MWKKKRHSDENLILGPLAWADPGLGVWSSHMWTNIERSRSGSKEILRRVYLELFSFYTRPAGVWLLSDICTSLADTYSCVRRKWKMGLWESLCLEVWSAALRLTAQCRGNTFLPMFITTCDVQIWPNKCNSYLCSGFFPLSWKKIGFSRVKCEPWCLCYICGPYLTQSVTELLSPWTSCLLSAVYFQYSLPQWLDYTAFLFLQGCCSKTLQGMPVIQTG